MVINIGQSKRPYRTTGCRVTWLWIELKCWAKECIVSVVKLQVVAVNLGVVVWIEGYRGRDGGDLIAKRDKVLIMFQDWKERYRFLKEKEAIVEFL